jgi:glycosyltransferase involved in cell wall biosynthesis
MAATRSSGAGRETIKIAIVNLVTKTPSVLGNPAAMVGMTGLGGKTDDGVNIVELASHIAGKGHEVHVWAADAFKPEQSAYSSGNPSVEYLPTRLKSVFPPAIFPLTPSLLRRFRHEKFDVVQSAELFQTGTLLSWLGIKGENVRFFIWQELDVIMRGPLGPAQRAFYRTLGRPVVRDGIIIPRSRSARKHLLDYHVPEERIGPVVHSGVDTTLFKPMDQAECRRAMGLETDRRVILTAGRFDHIKGLDIIIRAMQQVKKEAPDSLLVLQGAGSELDSLRQLVRELDLESNVTFISQTFPHARMPVLLNCADMVAITSRVDLFPFVAIEAIACGVPLISSFERGIKMDILDQGAGIGIPKAPTEMGRDIASIIRDDALLRRIGEKGRELAMAEFDFNVSAERLISIYGGSAG